MTLPLHIAFVWHMHQPYYKASRGGAFLLPWVRLHAIKDYLDMVELLDEFPTMHQTFNLVPSLVEQLEDYAAGGFRENHWDLTMKPAAALDQAERAFVVDLMCERSWHPRAQRYPRYLELALKREACLPRGLAACTAEFSVDELRDLQVWFNLAWFDPVYLHKEPLAGLVARGRGFSEDDKQALAQVQESILRRIIPAYREAERRGQVELTTSPYFHPILPLLINTDLARVSRADVTLPPRRFAHPEDAREQLELGLNKHAAVFGGPAQGLWCSEMALGEDVIIPLAEHGLRWTIGDEEHLARSQGRPLTRSDAGQLHEPARLYRPYLLEREGHRLEVVFRDHRLSDLIGFTYQSWAPQDAAANLVWRLREIRGELEGSQEPHLVTVALDGENAWEYYPDDGREFLHHLYRALAEDEGFSCVTVSEFLQAYPARRPLPWLHTGSWIYGDFSTWIGDPAHGPAWDHLHAARDAVAAKRRGGPPADPSPAGTPVPAAADLDEAWHHILVAEGSDWFWWFGEHQQSEIDHLWDLNFRQQLQEAYRLAAEVPPLELFAPILSAPATLLQTLPRSAFTPRIDGRLEPVEEWEAAGLYRLSAAGGTMQRAGGRVLEELAYGAGPDGLHFMLRPGREFGNGEARVSILLGIPSTGREPAQQTDPDVRRRPEKWGREFSPEQLGFQVLWEVSVEPLEHPRMQVSLAAREGGEWGAERPLQDAAWGEVLELTVPWGLLGPQPGPDRIQFKAGILKQGLLHEIWPPREALSLDLRSLGLLG